MVGIYKITNKINGHFYIGLSNDIERRFSEHKTPKNIKNKKTTLSKAFRKYGMQNFEFEILETCSIEELFEKEIIYINKLEPQYNMNEGGQGNTGHRLDLKFKNYLAELGKKQWDSMTKEQQEYIKIHNLKGPSTGHEVSKETREKLRQINLGKKLSQEHKNKIGESNSKSMIGNCNRKQAVAKIDKNTGEVLKKYETIKEAALEVNVHPTSILGVCKGKFNYCKGYKWKYISEL